jgi:DNA-binding XRE family transcriptional regulator
MRAGSVENRCLDFDTPEKRRAPVSGVGRAREAPVLFCCERRLAFVERINGVAETIANYPARPFEMGAPAGLGVARGDIDLHQRGCRVLPRATSIVRLEQGGVEGQMAAIIVDHGIAFWRLSLDRYHYFRPPLTGSDEYTPWIVTRQWRPPCLVSSRENLARNLKALRTSKGLSQEALADAAGIDRTYVSALERQKYSLSIDRLDQLAATLGVEPYMLLMSEVRRSAD